MIIFEVKILDEFVKLEVLVVASILSEIFKVYHDVW